MTQAVDTREAEAAYPRAEDAHRQHVADLTRAKAEARDGIRSLQEQIKDLQLQRDQLRRDLEELEARGEQVEELVAEAEPWTRHQLSLYAHVSKLTWQFDKSDRVVGTVSDPANGDIRRFELDPKAVPRAEIANRLWDLIDG
jgi:kinetochore protein Spc24, animal type